jgi:hypothetical protein
MAVVVVADIVVEVDDKVKKKQSRRKGSLCTL